MNPAVVAVGFFVFGRQFPPPAPQRGGYEKNKY